MRKFSYLLLLFLCACNQLLHVKVYKDDFVPESKVFSLTGDKKYMPELREALTNAGYTVLKNNQVRTITKNYNAIEDGDVVEAKEKYSNYTSQYIIDIVRVKNVDICALNPAVDYIDMDIEVFDAKTNEVILLIKSGGRTGFCFGSLISPNIFTGEIVPAIDKMFKDAPTKKLKNNYNFDN